MLLTGCDLAATQPHYNEIELHSGKMANRIVATQSEVHLEHHSAKYRIIIQNTFSHHYQGRIDFNTVNLFHSAGMDLACILASREGLAILYDFSGHKPDLEGKIQICFRHGFSRPVLVFKH